MSAERAYVEGYAAARGLRAEWEGEIGFGRECVGLIDPERDSYIAYAWGGNCDPPDDAPDAYHKDSYIAVLGRGDGAETQLAAWVRKLAVNGATFVYREKDVPDLTTLVYGHTDELTAVAA